MTSRGCSGRVLLETRGKQRRVRSQVVWLIYRYPSELRFTFLNQVLGVPVRTYRIVTGERPLRTPNRPGQRREMKKFSYVGLRPAERCRTLRDGSNGSNSRRLVHIGGVTWLR